MPFIVGGTAAAAILMNLIPLLDDRYAASPSTGTLVLFIVVLGLLLVSMGTYRSPAVALMPDVTPKPLRSRANAIINLMGAVGGILYLGLAAVLYPASKTQGRGACQLPAAVLHRLDDHGCGGGRFVSDHQGAQAGSRKPKAGSRSSRVEPCH